MTIIVEFGDSFGGIADTLEARGVVGSSKALRIAGRISGVDKRLTPGRYDFTGKNSPKSVLRRFRDADFLRIRLTIPEGSPIWKVASIVAQDLSLDSALFVSFDSDSSFLASYGIPGLEGYLFPETYYLAWGATESEVIDAMIKMYHRQTEDIWPDSLDNEGARYEVLKLASIIEAETGVSDERRLVSSVYHNRLRRGMKLDADPTVIYGLGGLDRPLYIKDLRRPTPYNTYINKGLPPTPINSPGLASIQAALDPAESDYLFFVADENGRHIFSRTNAEHNRARQKVKVERGK